MSTLAGQWLQRSVDDLQRFSRRSDGPRVVGCLAAGLTTLRNLLCVRIWGDVEKHFGVDSMCVPVSAAKARVQAYQEIEAYQIAEAVAVMGELRYASASADKLTAWLAVLLRKSSEPDAVLCRRVAEYAAVNADGRTRLLMDALAKIVRESIHSPLVLYQLLPWCVRVAVASAFGDSTAAEAARRRQVQILPSISDCRQCRGWVVDCAEPCTVCGNPLWTFDWLSSSED
jgi:hypothetical protein